LSHTRRRLRTTAAPPADLVDAPHLTLFPVASSALVAIGCDLPGDAARERLAPC
jgi:hypothetical protein